MRYIKELSKNGYPIYKCNNIYLYSKYDPIREAKRFVEQQDIKENVVTICGADYVNIELSKNEKVKNILSIEPIDFDNRVDIPKKITFKNIDNFEKFLWDKVAIDEIDINSISLIVWLPLLESDSNLFMPIIEKIASIIRKVTMSYLTEKKFMLRELRNCVKNTLGYSNIKILENKRVGEEYALIIASGASLYDHIEKIKNIKDYITIFSLPSSLPYLYYNGIDVDYAIAVDPGYATFYHISKYRKRLTLLTTLSITPSVLKINNINPIFFNYGSELENMIFKNINIITSYSEGSVIFNLLNILEKLDYKKVIIIGLDFSFKDHKSHIKEGYFEKEFLSKSSYFNTIDYYILSTMAKKDKTKIKINDKIFITDVALKTYYEHFIQKKFNIEILLFKDCYNPLSENIKKIDYYDLLEEIKDLKKRELFVKEININEKTKEVVSSLFLLKK